MPNAPSCLHQTIYEDDPNHEQSVSVASMERIAKWVYMKARKATMESKSTNNGPFSGVSIMDVAEDLRKGRTTCLEVTERSLSAAYKQASEINCFVSLDETGALESAALADEELSSGYDRGPLHGIPVGIKDIISTSGLKTEMGSKHFAGNVPNEDADVVASLRNAGAVVLGKTHAHEFAYGPTGDRALSGPAYNPHDVSRVTGGSSSGSAAAVAAGLVPAAIGTDTAGSVRIPASLCGVVGMRPTSGTVSRVGVFPLSETLDVVGPLAASVEDTAIVWRVLSSQPEHATGSSHKRPQPLYRNHLRSQPLRIGEAKCALTERVGARQREGIQMAIKALTQNDAVVTEIAIPEADESAQEHHAIQSAEAYSVHRARVRFSPDLFDPEILSQLVDASKVSGWQYVVALQMRDQLRKQLLSRLTEVDFLLMPTVPIDAPFISQRDLHGEGGWTSTRQALKSMTVPWSLMDFPAISIPAILSDGGLPCGIQLIGKPHQERELLAAAASLESFLKAM